MSIIVGIDVGLTSGVIAAVSFKARHVVQCVESVPVIQIKGGYKLDRANTFSLFTELVTLDNRKPITVYCETAQLRPKQNINSARRYTQVFDFIEGLCLGMNIDFYSVMPSVWKRHLDLIGSGKQASIDLAKKIYGSQVDLPYKKDHNKAEALLIAWYGWTYGDNI